MHACSHDCRRAHVDVLRVMGMRPCAYSVWSDLGPALVGGAAEPNVLGGAPGLSRGDAISMD